MKKFILTLIFALSVVVLAACSKTTTAKQEGTTTAGNASTYELAVVTDVGQLMDGGFNQGTYEGVVAYAQANNKSYKYYQPANGADATDEDRVAAMELAIENGAKVIVAPGFLQAAAMEEVATANPDVKFVFVDGWALGLNNVTAIVYKEQESGYLAGYGVVKEGLTELGGVFGGGGTNPACNRFAYGFVQGAAAAAAEAEATVNVKISFNYGSSFNASTELQTMVAGWYSTGTKCIFSCGGSMVNSVIAAASEVDGTYIVGVDTDQSGLSTKVITSAFKGLAASVQLVLTEYYAGEWDAKLADKASNLGAAEDATGLPTADGSWRFTTFTKEAYTEVFNKIKNGEVTPAADVAENCDDAAFWSAKFDSVESVNVSLIK